MSGRAHIWRTAVPALVVSALLLAGCGSSKDTSDASDIGSGATALEQTTTTEAGPLRILVTNDDGYDAPGIDAVVEAVRALPDTEVTVVAPLKNQSGTDGSTTPGPLTATDVKTASGYPAKAIDGFPADTIVWAIDQKGIDFTPDVVLSGINFGQNIGSLVEVSGTVGAARAAAARGIPALASSQGIGNPMDFPSGVTQVLDWLSTNRAAIEDGSATSPVLLENLNIPTCPTGSPRDLVEAPIATSDAGRDLSKVDCTSTATDPADDVAAFIEGFPVLSPLPLQKPAA
jgi:5'-nucleotidase